MVENKNEDLRYISNCAVWVTMVCPLKKYNKDNSRSLAYMIGDGPNIYHGNMFDAKPTDRKESFASYADILAAGWEVD